MVQVIWNLCTPSKSFSGVQFLSIYSRFVATGESIVDDWATMFVDIIPIRTPPRYGPPDESLQSQYKESRPSNNLFDPNVLYGSNHILPKLDESGRLENIPICKPSLLAYQNRHVSLKPSMKTQQDNQPYQAHRLIACVWASATYTIRGDHFAVEDGHRRLLEWITYKKVVGFDHIYLYDNTGGLSQWHITQSSCRFIS
jgi:hypothetical protein